MRRKATVTSYFDARASVPMIRLRGQWLLQAGFREGDLIEVEVAAGRLILARPPDPLPTCTLPEEYLIPMAPRQPPLGLFVDPR
jgi:Toxin SymE, type I toxin-antitoxin system